MAEFSGGAAILSGLRLIGQRPGAVLAWGLVYVAISLAPLGVLFWSFLPDLLLYYTRVMPALMAGSAQALRDPHLLAIQSELAAFQLTQLGLTLAASAVVSSAIYRAVLEPERHLAGFLRLGLQELWVGLSLIVYYLALVVTALGASVAVLLVSQGAGPTVSWTMGLVLFLLSCGGVALVIWVALRLSMMGPLSFSRRGVQIVAAWRMTTGQGWRLFAVAAALAAMIIAVETMVVAVGQALGFDLSLARMEQARLFLLHPPADALARAAPVLAGLGGFQIVLSGLSFALWTAPFAEVYRELSKPQIGIKPQIGPRPV